MQKLFKQVWKLLCLIFQHFFLGELEKQTQINDLNTDNMYTIS